MTTHRIDRWSRTLATSRTRRGLLGLGAAALLLRLRGAPSLAAPATAWPGLPLPPTFSIAPAGFVDEGPTRAGDSYPLAGGVARQALTAPRRI